MVLVLDYGVNARTASFVLRESKQKRFSSGRTMKKPDRKTADTEPFRELRVDLAAIQGRGDIQSHVFRVISLGFFPPQLSIRDPHIRRQYRDHIGNFRLHSIFNAGIVFPEFEVHMRQALATSTPGGGVGHVASAHAMLLLHLDELADVPRNVFDGLGPTEIGGEFAVRAREQPLGRRALPRC